MRECVLCVCVCPVCARVCVCVCPVCACMGAEGDVGPLPLWDPPFVSNCH